MMNSYVWKIQPFEGELWRFDDHLRSLEVPHGSSFDEYVAVMLAAAQGLRQTWCQILLKNFARNGLARGGKSFEASFLDFTQATWVCRGMFLKHL